MSNDTEDNLSIEELISLLSAKEDEELQKHLQKLEFLVRLRYTEEEIEALKNLRPRYPVSVSIPIDKAENRVYIDLQICGDYIDVGYCSSEDTEPLWHAFGKMIINQETKFNVKL